MSSENGTGVLRVVPLGGLGEIGVNCLLIEYNGYAIAVDCGVMFPELHMPGIDLVIPDLTYLQQFGDRFLGFVVTHGHEDHIGALPYVLRDIDAPVYAPPMAAGLLTEKLKEHSINPTIHVVRPRHPWELGPFKIESIHMTHSIVDTVALAITTPLGVIIHSGDFKLDPSPVDNAASDLDALAEYAERGVLLLLSDSTNAERPGRTDSERSVRGDIDRIFKKVAGKVFFSTFSSHIARLTQVIEVSQSNGRKVAVVGRSLLNTIKIATGLGYLSYSPSTFIDTSGLKDLAPHQTTVLITGSQGEPMSALIRIAEGAHGQVKMEPDDAVILSSRIIPGNERPISNMINHIHRRGATPYHSHNCAVHVSGHASQEELKDLMRLLKPKYFIPVHGEYRHLVQHRTLAHEVGISPDNTFLLENGNVLEIDAQSAHRAESVRAGRVFVDGKGVGDIQDIVLRDRRHLSSDGLVLAILAINQQNGTLLSGPDLISRGFVPEEGTQAYLEKAKSVVVEVFEALPFESRTDSLVVKEEVRKSLKKYFSKTLERRPVIVPFIMEM